MKYTVIISYYNDPINSNKIIIRRIWYYEDHKVLKIAHSDVGLLYDDAIQNKITSDEV